MMPQKQNEILDLVLQVCKMTKNLIKIICIFTLLIALIIISISCIKCEATIPDTEAEASIGVGREQVYAYDITSVEREMIARLVYREANTESIECQKAIISVIINRWQSGLWGGTLEEVVYAKNQFAPASLLYCTTPTEINYEAVDEVIENGITIPEYIFYFRADYHFKWDGYKAYKKIDNTCLGYMEKDVK